MPPLNAAYVLKGARLSTSSDDLPLPALMPPPPRKTPRHKAPPATAAAAARQRLLTLMPGAAMPASAADFSVC